MSRAQVDKLGDRLRQGAYTEADLQELARYRDTFSAAYRAVISVLRDGLSLEPTGRPAKSTSAIVEKLLRETIRLSQIQDIAGVRLVVPNLLAQEEALANIMRSFPKASVVDRRKQPSHGYRAIHVVVGIDGRPVEIQLRTELQHKWAEVSEKLADTLDPAVKYGGGPKSVRVYLTNVSELIAGVEELEADDRALVDRMAGRDDIDEQDGKNVLKRTKRTAGIAATLRSSLDELLEGIRRTREAR